MNYNSGVRVNELSSGESKAVERCPENTSKTVIDVAGHNEKNVYDCYLDNETTCYKLLNARSKAFVTFAEASDATNFVNNFYGSKNEEL